MKKIFLLTVLFFVFTGVSLPKYHPAIKWREIREKKFIVIFPKGYESEARYTINIAHDIYKKLHKLWGNRIRGRIRIVLNDSYDEANGSATFFPFNLVEINLFTPPPDSTIGGCRDWIYMVLSHEMTHLFNMNAGSGFTYFMRSVLGHNPVLYPMIYAPIWLVEGWAVYAESLLCPGGRLDTPDFGIMLKKIGAAGKIPDSSRIYGEPTTWPGTESHYLYGAKFIEFLVNRYGAQKVRLLARDFGYYFIPVIMAKRFEWIFHKNLNQLWDEFIDSCAAGKANDKLPIDVLTTDGLIKKYPVFGPGNKIFYAAQNYTDFPGIYELDLTTGRSGRLLKKRGVNSLYYSKIDNKIYFSASCYFKSFYRYSDLYEYDIGKRKSTRLSKGRRLSYPVKTGDKIYCVKRVKTKSFLAIFDPGKGKEKIISGGFDSLSQISISPDHRYIAAVVKEKNSSWRIALYSSRGFLLRFLSESNIKSFAPQWQDMENLYFLKEDKGSYRLASVNIRTGSSFICRDNYLPDIKYFSFRPAVGNLIVSFFDYNGFNLGLLKVPPVENTSPPSGNSAAKKEEQLTISNDDEYRVKKYQPLRDLFPEYFSVNYRDAGREKQPGIYISGNDALEKHAYVLETFYGFKSKSLNVHLNYTYNGFYPAIVFNFYRYTDTYQNQDNRDYAYHLQKFEMAGLLPLSLNEKRQSYLYAGIYFEKIRDEFEENAEHVTAKRNGFRLAYLFSSIKKYYDSISYADGQSLSVSYAGDFKSFGSSVDIHTLTFEYRRFLSLFRPNVLAIRLAFSDSRGKARRILNMGGADSIDEFSLAGSNMFNLMRGFPRGYFRGYGGYLLNLEYRLSLFKVERVFTVIRSIDRVYLTLFTDSGHLWQNDKKIDPAYSFGLELNVVAYIGDGKFDFAGGVAVGQHPRQTPVFYLRLGRSF